MAAFEGSVRGWIVQQAEVAVHPVPGRGGLWGLLFGSALFVIPGVGPLFAAGPLVAWIAGGLEGATLVGGMSALGAGLYGIGIPKDSVLSYETQIKAGKFVVIAHGTRDEVDKSQAILVESDHHDGNAHNCCAS